MIAIFQIAAPSRPTTTAPAMRTSGKFTPPSVNSQRLTVNFLNEPRAQPLFSYAYR
jgi:hypothetical protein